MTNAHVIDGKALAQRTLDDLKLSIAKHNHHKRPGLATVLVGSDPASKVYVARKRKSADYVGIKSLHIDLPEDTSEESLLGVIKKLNQDPNIHAILVQMPLPKHIREDKIIEAIDPSKDVDGFHPLNLGYLACGRPRVIACTPLGVLHLIKSIGYDLCGKHAVVVGRSTIVGRPMALLLLKEDATVTICHRMTKNLSEITKTADLLVVAVGIPRFITRDYLKPGAIVIDVGINKVENNRLCGDVDFDDVRDVASFITPVPGGVGPMTIAMLLKNSWENFLRSET